MADTIAAIATAPGTGAIGILRLSGPAAVDIAGRLFRPADGRPLEAHRPHTLVYGALLGPGGEVIDRALATFSRAPRSYTGEDTAEFQCHGSPMVLQLGLEAVFAQGARQAGPGEFTRRAFLNGRLDLAQAEAVADWLEGLGLLNDLEYAKNLVRHYERKGYGTRKIRDELYRRGVPREYWDEALEEREGSEEAIDAFLRARLKGGLPEGKELKRVTDALTRRGFSWPDIAAGLRRYGAEVED